MAISGSTNLSSSRNAIIKRAMRVIGVLEAGEEPEANEITDGAEVLEQMVKAWSVQGTRLWKLEEVVVFLTKGTAKYTLSTAGDNAAIEDDTVKTELSGDEATSSTVIDVDSATGIVANDIIGIVLDDGTIHWTTVDSVATNAITVATGLASAASENNHVYAYTNKVAKPLRIIDARRRDDAEQDIPIEVTSRQEYMQTPNKTIQGKPTMVYYDPQRAQGELHVWQTPDTVNDRLILTAHIPIDDFDTATNEPDFPQEWFETLAYGLAVRLLPEYGIGGEQAQLVMTIAANMKGQMDGFDDEPVSIQFSLDLVEGGYN